MKRAGAAALEQLDPILAELRRLPGLAERKPGIFYRGAAAFLHFHEDAAGLFADVKLDGASFQRMRVSSAQERRDFVRAIRALAILWASTPREV